MVDSSSSGKVKSCPSHPKRVYDKCLETHCALYAPKPNVWYFDSGCSCHTMGDKEAFLSLVPANGNIIEFGGGCMPHITGKGNVKIPKLPQLENVCYVARLTTNLLSISQLCDDVADEVSFSKRCCKIIDKYEENMLVVPRSKGNCYSRVIPKGVEHTNWNKETYISWVPRGSHISYSLKVICVNHPTWKNTL